MRTRQRGVGAGAVLLLALTACASDATGTNGGGAPNVVTVEDLPDDGATELTPASPSPEEPPEDDLGGPSGSPLAAELAALAAADDRGTVTVDGVALPATFVAALADGRGVVVETATGEVLRALPGFDRPSDPNEEEAGGFGLSEIVRGVSDDDLFLVPCCEPAVGVVLPQGRPLLEDPARAGSIFGLRADLSDDGRQLVTTQFGSLGILDLLVADLEARSRTIGDPDLEREGAFGGAAFDATGTRLVVEDTATRGVRVLTIADGLEDSTLLAPRVGRAYRTPEWRADGNLLVAEVDVELAGSFPEPGDTGVGVALDPASGARLGEFALPSVPVAMRYDDTRSFLLVPGYDGSLRWFGAGRSGVLAPDLDVVDADW